MTIQERFNQALTEGRIVFQNNEQTQQLVKEINALTFTRKTSERERRKDEIHPALLRDESYWRGI